MNWAIEPTLHFVGDRKSCLVRSWPEQNIRAEITLNGKGSYKSYILLVSRNGVEIHRQMTKRIGEAQKIAEEWGEQTYYPISFTDGFDDTFFWNYSLHPPQPPQK